MTAISTVGLKTYEIGSAGPVRPKTFIPAKIEQIRLA